MALSRRTGQRFQGSIWPGFVDAMTGLLLVMMFVLTIFMVVQFVLRETISGQESELDILSSEVAALAQALGLEERRGQQLEARMGALTETLNNRTSELQRQAALIANLTRERDDQAVALEDAQTRITSFEAQVATLLSQRDDALGTIAALESEQDRLLSEQEQLLAEQGRLMSEQDALNLALAQSRSEIDAQSEAARLAAARREALEALVADLRAENADANAQADALTAELNETMQALSEEEAARLAEAAAAEALRNRLENADAELTAMTLSLEAQRQQAEDTLTLLAAARAAQKELDARLLVALGEVDTLKSDTAADVKALKDQLSEMMAARLAAQEEAATQQSLAEQRAALLAAANQTLAQEEAASAESQRQTELLNQQVAALRNQLGELQSLLDDARARDVAANVQLESLGAELNTALARVAAEERKRRLLEEAERIRLEEERKRLEAERNQLADQTQDLQKYRSEFFGRLRDVLGNQDGVRIEGDRFVFSSEVLFPPASATLSGEGQQEIAKIATILQSVADDIPPEINWVIRVDGHTDNQPLSGFGEFADNWELSQARALSVVRYMTGSLGIPPDRLAANGFGEFQPVNTADTPEAYAQNRRIELKFTEK
jgi:chemotaxis protein MotB